MEKTITMSLPRDRENKKVKMDLSNGMPVEIEVIEILPLAEKTRVIEEIVNECVNNEFNYFNPLYLRTLAEVKTIEACTNIICDYSDLYEFHDILRFNKIFSEILPLTDFQEILNWSYECAESLCKYKNSFMGVLQTIGSAQNQQGNIDEQMKQILSLSKTIKEDPEIQDFMNSVAPHLV